MIFPSCSGIFKKHGTDLLRPILIQAPSMMAIRGGQLDLGSTLEIIPIYPKWGLA